MVDIIIPAYNCSKTLPRALASVMTQTAAKKCIVTVVDDYSTEDLKSIVNGFRPYLHLRYIKLNKNHGFPGIPRQVGINNSNAPFIVFLDADDMLAPEAIDKLNKTMISSTADMAIGTFYAQKANKTLELYKEDKTTWVHGNIYRRSFLEKYNIQFPEGCNEDGAFNTQCYLLADKILSVDTPCAYWLQNEESITRSVKEHFAVKYGDHIVNTLLFAYKNVLLQAELSDKILKNLGSHLAFFYDILNVVRYEVDHNGASENRYNEILETVYNFSEKLPLKNLNDVQVDSLKEGFKNSYIKGFYPKHKGQRLLILKDYFYTVLNLPYTVEAEDLMGGLLNESYFD